MTTRSLLIAAAVAIGAVVVVLYGQLHRDAPSAAQAASGTGSSASPPPAVVARAEPRPTLDQRELAQWTMLALDDIFDAEPRNDRWAPAREQEIRETSKDKRLSGITSIDVECRSTMCRVVVGLEPTTARRTLHALLVTPPLNTSGFHGVDPVDERKLRLFVSKEGTALMEHPAYVEALQVRTNG